MRNQFNLSHEHKTSLDMGKLIPIMTEEVLPGDTMRFNASALTRIAPLINPVMHRVELRMNSFFVPNRIVWDDWEDFITGEKDVAVPIQGSFGAGTLTDYMGMPHQVTNPVTALPIRCFNKIYNEFFRDQDLGAERPEDDVTVPNVMWQKDYFTVARPSPQQGTPEPIPLTGEARVYGTVPPLTAGATVTATEMTAQAITGDRHGISVKTGGSAGSMMALLQDGNIQIDDLRRSIALQRFAEARMRFGSRYVDYLRYIGVNPSDGRLDRPEYLGGGKETLAFSEVLSTAEGQSTNVGDMYGHGIGMVNSNQWQKMFEEHGWVITTLNIRPKAVYQNAMPKKFHRMDPMDYWQKELEVLPWQEVKNEEIYSDHSDPTGTFGYVPRYEEYRHGVSHVSNTLRGGTENDWHLAREFSSEPTLNESFITCQPSERIFQDSNMPNAIVNCKFNIQCRRFVGQTARMGVDL